jgi:predicted dithiol-disulfide oxidoreductase (DUF899 family)
VFEGAGGSVRLSELFAGRSQLIVQHFMFDPEWQAGCKSCSFWADGLDSFVAHVNQRDANVVMISRAPYAKLAAFKKRMGWHMDWVSAAGNSFNQDFGVSHPKDDKAPNGNNYNFGTARFTGEAPGISVFFKDGDGAIYRTYSCYARGLDMMNGAYHYIDLLPKGRDEAALSYPMAWVRLHDEYGKSA